MNSCKREFKPSAKERALQLHPISASIHYDQTRLYVRFVIVVARKSGLTQGRLSACLYICYIQSIHVVIVAVLQFAHNVAECIFGFMVQINSAYLDVASRVRRLRVLCTEYVHCSFVSHMCGWLHFLTLGVQRVHDRRSDAHLQ